MPQKFVSKRIPKTDYPRLGALEVWPETSIPPRPAFS